MARLCGTFSRLSRNEEFNQGAKEDASTLGRVHADS